MTSRRAPLANVPQAVNSPFRNGVVGSGKRSNAHLGHGGQGQPPAKKQVIELSDDDTENVDPRKRNGVPPTAFEQKLAAAREKKVAVQQPTTQQANTERTQKDLAADDVDAVRQWQRYYRRQFPTFVIYFDNLPDDVRSRTLRQILLLGAREEKFFSKSVTHVITTRQIPPELTSTSPDEDGRYDVGHVTHNEDARKPISHGSDILTRARHLGIKIWALEKLQRMLSLLEAGAADDVGVSVTRSQVAANKVAPKPTKDADLEQLLRNEKITGPTDRDMTVAAQDMCVLQGIYIYIHDMNEQTRPVMVRDYTKPKEKEAGKWPQFRLTGEGRCPFVDDPQMRKKVVQEQAARAQDELAAVQRQTRTASTQQVAKPAANLPRVLSEQQTNLRRSPRKLDSKPLAQADAAAAPQPAKPSRQSSTQGMLPLFGSAQHSLRGTPRMIGGEPVASGMQHSNITSAIRSQYISSTAISSTAPGANFRVGDSKEVSALKRKVLERGASVPSNHSMPSSYMNDMRAAINNDRDPPPRAAKRKAQETLGVLYEDAEDGSRASKQRKQAPKRQKPIERDPKPGYCENCRDKFDDFDEHCLSRKHRKFALAQENWAELDALLTHLKRPHKVVQ
ncbi:hypothetical protein BAUCODRAFT_82627 [Baudoinia panamericana UAMH 10762]|uniref:DBF4-type domain-containing protein n=1 Tax=Baudoinia panamericana (strain UAMH 10762) TaxID=717646 RepID=M2NK70_BAUPA|nr:uncharacterized protein BAUCODRAFT_82627 [Baudoinia panamericana UAMH 10762]EMC99505.1 hypothetical protein BAUCODRAFT_82627 [Baudoinia panamericana UAMH 10762]